MRGLIKNLLIKDQNKRYTIDNILSHEEIQKTIEDLVSKGLTENIEISQKEDFNMMRTKLEVKDNMDVEESLIAYIKSKMSTRIRKNMIDFVLR